MKVVEIVRNIAIFHFHALRFVPYCFSMHSCDARAIDGVGVSDVVGFYGAIFEEPVTHHVLELGVSGVSDHGLGLAGLDGILDFVLCESFITLPDGLGHRNGSLACLHVDVVESAADALFFVLEHNFVALGGGHYPIAARVIFHVESIILELWEGEEVGRAITDQPKVEKVKVPSFLGGKCSAGIAVGA
jgi:hypothetical protein